MAGIQCLSDDNRCPYTVLLCCVLPTRVFLVPTVQLNAVRTPQLQRSVSTAVDVATGTAVAAATWAVRFGDTDMLTNAGAPCLSENHTSCSPFCIPYPALLILSFPLLPLEWLCHFTAHSHAQPPMAQLHSAAGSLQHWCYTTRHTQSLDGCCMHAEIDGTVNQALYYCCLLLTPPTTTDEALQCPMPHTPCCASLT